MSTTSLADGGSRVVVAGGGLVGSLLAVYLSEWGHDVEVYEGRSDIRDATGDAGRSINLVLTNRGLRALEPVGLSAAALAMTVPVHGRMMHSPSGELAYQPYGRDESECNYSISRSGLNRLLMTEAEKRGARFHFERKLERVDFARNSLVFSGTRDRVSFELLFGTDGAGSTVRRSMEHAGYCSTDIEMLSHGYKELDIPATPGGGFRIEKHALHIWPRGAIMLMALPNPDGSFTVTLYLPEQGEDSFEKVDTPEAVMELFRSEFPDAIPLISDLPQAFFDNPLGHLGTVRCEPWNAGDRVLLLGDASHGIVPFFGQGMNSGFEDIAKLAERIESDASDRASLFGEFSRTRKRNADAIADMALDNFVEMCDRVGDPDFLKRKALEHLLETEMPERYRSRYSLVMYSTTPYAVAQEAGRIQETLLAELCDGLDRVEDVDRERAQALIAERLAPFFASNAVDLSY